MVLSLAEQRQRAIDEYFDAVAWRPWQQAIIDICEGPTDERSIHWIVDEKGGAGKSMLAQYLQTRFKGVIASGKKADVFNQVLTHAETNLHVTVAVLDVPREALEYVHYGTIECVKNGFLYSGKYEGGVWSQSRAHAPHVICFANEMPKTTKMSLDRWKIYKIVENQLELEKDYEYVQTEMQNSDIDFS